MSEFINLNTLVLEARYSDNTIELDEQVECQWCHGMFERCDLRKETNMGYICDACARAIESRGEELTFVE